MPRKKKCCACPNLNDGRMYCFPKYRDGAKLWLDLLGKPELIDRYTKIHVCEAHFSDKMLVAKKKRTTATAIPDRNLPEANQQIVKQLREATGPLDVNQLHKNFTYIYAPLRPKPPPHHIMPKKRNPNLGKETLLNAIGTEAKNPNIVIEGFVIDPSEIKMEPIDDDLLLKAYQNHQNSKPSTTILSMPRPILSANIKKDPRFQNVENVDITNLNNEHGGSETDHQTHQVKLDYPIDHNNIIVQNYARIEDMKKRCD